MYSLQIGGLGAKHRGKAGRRAWKVTWETAGTHFGTGDGDEVREASQMWSEQGWLCEPW